MTTLRRRGAVAAAAGLAPWILIPYEAGLSLVFSFGLVTPATFHVQTVVDYVFAATRGLPPSLLAYPTASVLYVLAVGSLSLSAVDREDRRVTAGLFGLAGLDLLYFAVSFSSTRLGIVAVPLGTALLWLAAWANRPDSWSLSLA
jgi:uncharacterized protein (TIGR04206 family)